MTRAIEVAREGGTWRSLVEHPDFRGLFLPGTEQHRDYQARLKAARSRRRSTSTRRRARLLAAAALMVGSVGLAGYSISTGLLTVPEPITIQLSEWLGSVGDQVGESVDFSRNTDPDSIVRELPGGELISMLPEPVRAEPLPILLQSGWSAWWSGTDAGIVEARVAFESAVVIAPDDVEALGGLVEVYSDLVAFEPALRDPMTAALTRMMAIDSDAIATLRAQAADAWVTDQSIRITRILSACGAPIAGLYDTVDLGCAVRLAEARGDDDTLSRIHQQTGSYRVAMIRARTAVAQNDWGAALTLSRALVRTSPDEAEPWVALALSSVRIGDWQAAESAAEEAVRRAGHRLDLVHLRGKIQLRALSGPTAAYPILRGLVDDPRLAQYPDRILALNDAAEAAIALGKNDEALALTERVLLLDSTDPTALVQQGWLHHLNADIFGAEESLRKIEPGQLSGASGARTHLGVARVYLAINNQRSAASEIESALQSDSTMIEALLDGALADSRVNNLDAAVEKVTRAPLFDVVYTGGLSPLDVVWVPPADLSILKQELGSALSNDVRYSVRLKEILAIIDWFDGRSTAEASLRVALLEGGNTGASAALAQHLFSTNRPNEALPFIDAVLTSESDNTTFLAMRSYAQALTSHRATQKSIDRALSLDSMDPVVLHWTTAAREALGGKSELRSTLETLLLISPSDVKTRAHLISLPAD